MKDEICASKEELDIPGISADAKYTIFADSKHLHYGIIHFVTKQIYSGEYDHLFVEVSKHIEPEILYVDGPIHQDREALRILNEWTARPDAMAYLLDVAREKDVEVHFIDDLENLTKMEEMVTQIKNAAKTDLHTAREMVGEMMKHRMSVNATFVEHIKSVEDVERAAIFTGEGHVAGNNDLDEMLGGKTTVVAVYPDSRHKLIGHEELGKHLGEIEDADHCVLLTPDPTPRLVDKPAVLVAPQK